MSFKITITYKRSLSQGCYLTHNHPVHDRKHPVHDTISEETVPVKRLYHSIRCLHLSLILINNSHLKDINCQGGRAHSMVCHHFIANYTGAVLRKIFWGDDLCSFLENNTS